MAGVKRGQGDDGSRTNIVLSIFKVEKIKNKKIYIDTMWHCMTDDSYHKNLADQKGNLQRTINLPVGKFQANKNAKSN